MSSEFFFNFLSYHLGFFPSIDMDFILFSRIRCSKILVNAISELTGFSKIAILKLKSRLITLLNIYVYRSIFVLPNETNQRLIFDLFQSIVFLFYLNLESRRKPQKSRSSDSFMYSDSSIKIYIIQNIFP